MTNTTYNFIMDIISSKSIKLSKSERVIVDKIKDMDLDLAKLHIGEFANLLELSNSTITRFAQKLGFDGYSELKFKISQKLQSPKSLSQEIYKNFIDSCKAFDDRTIDFIKSLASFGKIAVIGIGSSGLCANEFVYKFGEIGLDNTDYAKEPYSINLLSKGLSEDDLLIAISLSGENHNLLEGVDNAKANRAKILAITGDGESTLAKEASLAIILPPYPKYSYNISKIFPVTFMLDMICEAYLS